MGEQVARFVTGFDQTRAQIIGQVDRRFAELHFTEQLMGRAIEYFTDKAVAIKAAGELANPPSHLLGWPSGMFKRAAVPVTALALFGMGSAGAVSSRSEGDNSAHVLQQENGVRSMREALNGIGLDILGSVEAQQNPAERYFSNTTFIDRSGNQVFLGVDNSHFGTAPNPTDVIVPRVDIYINNNFTDRFQLNAADYQRIASTGIGSIYVNDRGFIVMGTAQVEIGTGKVFLLGGTSVNYYDTLLNPRDLSRQIRLPDRGISQIEIVSNPGATLDLVSNGTSCVYSWRVLGAADVRNNGVYNLDANCTTSRPNSDTWVRQGNATETPAVTRTATLASTSTATVFTPTPRETATPVSSLRNFGVTEMSSNRIQMNWTQRTGSIGSIIARISSSRGVELLPTGGIIPPTEISYIDILPPNMTGVVCEGLLVLGTAGLLEQPNFICNFLETKSGLAPENLSTNLDAISRSVTFRWRAPGGQTDYVFAALASGRISNLDGTATSVTFPGISGSDCFVGVTLNSGQKIGNSNVVCVF